VAITKTNFTNPEAAGTQIDIVINNAGVAPLKPLGNINVADFNELYSTNVLGPIYLLQACLPYLPTDRSGRIVNVSSVGCALGFRDQTVYAGSKGALEAMTRVWAHELAERATVNSVSPGPVLSDIYMGCPDDIKLMLGQWNAISPLATVRPQDEEALQAWIKFGGRPAYGFEVAGAVAMLCHPEAAWTTGSVISANGGMRFSY
jgi:NAD(P)-dependent dehydrogenase (short-subunit alcohol dehydrogenase family)